MSNVLHAAARIIWDVVIYRLRRGEMANVLAALTVLVAMGVGWSESLLRLSFAVVLNLLVYLTNDYYDVDADLAHERRPAEKARFLLEHLREARWAQGALLGLLAAMAMAWSKGLVVTLALATVLCWLYSSRLKRLPGFDLLVILACGIVSAMTAFPLDRALGWVLAGQLGLFAAAFQTVQMLRDRDADLSFGTSTTAVEMGERQTVWLHRALLVASAAYASLLIHRWVGLALLVAPLLPVRIDRAEAHWNELRLLLGIGWLVMITAVVVTGQTNGWLGVVSRAATLPFGTSWP